VLSHSGIEMATFQILIEFANFLVLLFTALVVLKYTRETYKLRIAAQEQKALIAEQVLLASRTYELESKRHDFEMSKEVSLLDPILESQGSHYKEKNPHDAEINFINNGGTIKNISIHPKGNFKASIKPADVISSGRGGRIILSNVPYPDEQQFELRYENLAGQKRTKLYSYSKGHFIESSA
jgi:hypothetical protein